MAAPVQGYVYVWRVPVAIETGDNPHLKGEDLCLIKVGKSKAHEIWNRLYPQNLSWRKLMASAAEDDKGEVIKKTVGTNTFPIVDMDKTPDFPSTQADHDIQGAAEFAEKTFCEMREGEHSDLCFFLQRQDGHHLDDDERFVRSLFGLSARTSFMEKLRNGWNAKKAYLKQAPGKAAKGIANIMQGQLGTSEFVITTVAQFEKARSAFLSQALFTDFSLDSVASALSPTASLTQNFTGIDIGVTLPFTNANAVHCIRVTRYFDEKNDLDAFVNEFNKLGFSSSNNKKKQDSNKAED